MTRPHFKSGQVTRVDNHYRVAKHTSRGKSTKTTRQMFGKFISGRIFFQIKPVVEIIKQVFIRFLYNAQLLTYLSDTPTGAGGGGDSILQAVKSHPYIGFDS
jgi:hypothetical protein